jgi:hypothetical protein
MPKLIIHRHLFLLGCLVSSTLLAQTNTPFPTTSPEVAAREAFSAGNLEYLKAPNCREVVPLDRGTKKVPMPTRVFSRCEDFKTEWQGTQAAKWEGYARRYNNTMFDLRNRKTKP